MKRKKISAVLFLLLCFFSIEVYSQHFTVSPFIDLPGDNLEFDVLYPEIGVPNSETYICWVNKLDSTYTVYLRKISPTMGKDIIVSSDSQIKSRPQIAINRYAQGIKMVWQCHENNYWRIYLKNFYADQLSDISVLVDSLIDIPHVSLSIHRLAWINNRNLFIKTFYPSLSGNILIDSLYCSSPELLKYDALTSTQILYEKNYIDSVKVNMVSYNQYRSPNYQIDCLSNGLMNINPKFGMMGEITFQTYQNTIWKSIYSLSSYNSFVTTSNKNCNYKNPVLYSYPVTTSLSNSTTPFFLAFDSDSLNGNNEIFIKPFYFSWSDSIVNVSHSAGNDYEPNVVYLSNADTAFIAILWKHTENNKTNIWIAKDIYSPIISDVHKDKENIHSFTLIQNYPNPFNPITNIEYTIGKPGNVQIKVFDILGREIKTIVNEYKNAGNYTEIFNASNLSSGIYYCRLINGNNVMVKSMVLLK
jgi:hypothetical protein